MNMLVRTLADIVKERVLDATKGRSGARLESRFIFHGPPLVLLEAVFEELVSNGGIQVPQGPNDMHASLPVILQLPSGVRSGGNPGIGTSGRCDENHLLHIRNDPHSPSFVALVPPGQHNNKSVASTTEEFGMHSSSNTGHATFEEWWNDGFIQQLVSRGLKAAGLEEELGGAIQLVERAAEAFDEMDRDEGSRNAAWRLLARIYSIPDEQSGLSAGSALALACGVPPMQEGGISPKLQLDILAKIADELADGFKTGVDRIAVDSSDSVKQALAGFLEHIQKSCDVTTAFEHATQAFYVPTDAPMLTAPPAWWETLTAECWTELLSEEPDEAAGAISITCANAILPVVRNMPAIVSDEVVLTVSLDDDQEGRSVEALLTGGSYGKTGMQLLISSATTSLHDTPPISGHRTPLTYKVDSAGLKPAKARVISLAYWTPSILVTCRMANKFSPPRKPRKARTRTGPEWESSISLPGSGRYELLLLTSPGTSIIEAVGVSDDATETDLEGPETLAVHEVRSGEYQLEIVADGKYQLDVTFQPPEREKETCRIYITCEDAREEGCRSEFERLIKRNRQHLEKFDTKAVVQLDRHARSSSLQSWILDEYNVAKSFIPLILADDYATHWAPPDWDAPNGPILSEARFLHDPRPEAGLFNPPQGFVEARRAIAERVRKSTEDQSGLVESAPLGKWLARDEDFRALVEAYLDAYTAWLASDRDVACWVDAIAVCSREAGGRTLARVPDAIILSPLHPLRLAWHCLAQQVLHDEVEGSDPRPCPAASILDPGSVPDLLTISLQSPGGIQGIDRVDFLSIECNSDYWSVLWNGSRLGGIAERSRQPPFDNTFGLVVGGISSGFSPAQVGRALEDVTDLLAAKSIVSLAISSAGGTTDACNEGLTSWCTKRLGYNEKTAIRHGVGPRILEVYDTRPSGSRPDQATLANLSEDTANQVRWFERQPTGAIPDLGIIAQLDSAQPESTEVGIRSPLGFGGLIRHRVRRRLHGAFLSESRQALPMPPSGDTFPDKISSCIIALESSSDGKIGLQFAPDVHAVSSMLNEHKAGFVAVSSSAIDPACFLSGWIQGAYLWDYDLPSYSQRAGDTSGYYLLSQVGDADCESLARVLEPVPGGKELNENEVEEILLEVARRGIPTIRGLSGDDTGATGDLGLFLAVRLLQDQFRISGNLESLLPVISGSEGDTSIAIIIPVDPFRGYLADLARSLGKERKDASLSRPDLLVFGIHASQDRISLHLTPIEVKCRQGSTFSANDARDALGQAKALSVLFRSIQERASKSQAWRLAFQHLLLSMVSFGLRVYSQHEQATAQAGRWADYHERITAEILGSSPSSISIDDRGRLIVVDSSLHSSSRDHDDDGLEETIVISRTDAGRMVTGDAQAFYDDVRNRVGNWGLLPKPDKPDSKASMLGPSTSGEDAEVVSQSGATYSPSAASKNKPADSSDLDIETLVKAAGTPNSGQVEAGTGLVLSVGQTVDGFEPHQLKLNISDTRLNQLNIGVVGDLGTGKTQLLKSLIFQIVTSRQKNQGIKPRFLIFDYKRDYSSPEFVAATGAKVVKPSRLPLNLFDTTSMDESVAPWLDRFRFFADVLDKVYSGIGPVQRDKLKSAVRNAYEACGPNGNQPTIYDIHAEYRELLGGKSDSPMAIIDDLVDMEVFEREPSKTQSFDEFFDGVVVISLDAMGQDDRSKNMLVAIMLNMFYENMLRTPKRPFIGEDPQLRVIDSYLLVDEADNIMRYEFDVLRKLLLQGREFGSGVILASQYLRHFKASATDYREPLLTWFIHKVPNATPAELGTLGFTTDLGDLSDQVKTLPNHHCLYKSFDVAGEVVRGLPFYELVEDKLEKD
ncbi:type IV secretory system conjugative DNA transfer family protein [Halomonas sp. M5N1S17]|uniref:type IV secretory system conjugative DNA transfer family protein n=1 Tax=Halomonas alkalisoli TaxID=2907158 RepID=UPI001F42F144|nr:type IV secretory system conjugative DNA transfer family protein [Halomonas alkalisoli]MCE9665267.1 type IV secretory system conjugative DNA transfer family protein [Halomonas alkalisoli]